MAKVHATADGQTAMCSGLALPLLQLTQDMSACSCKVCAIAVLAQAHNTMAYCIRIIADAKVSVPE